MSVAWPEGARELAERCAVARLATADATGAPHVVPICFVLENDVLYTVVDDKPKPSTRGLKRLSNIAENPRATVLVDHYEEDWSKLEYLMLRGRAELVEDGVVFLKIRAALRKKYEPYRSMNLTFATHPLIGLHIERVHYWHA